MTCAVTRKWLPAATFPLSNTQRTIEDGHRSQVLTLAFRSRHGIRAIAPCRRKLPEFPVNRRRSIAEIAVSAGFRGASHFTHRFSERYGKSPKAFRRRAARQATSGLTGTDPC